MKDNFQDKRKDQGGCFSKKDPDLLAWRRYCHHEFKLKPPGFYVVCCNIKYAKASGSIENTNYTPRNERDCLSPRGDNSKRVKIH